MICPKAKGINKKSTGFKPVLVNDNEKAFIVDPKVFIVWSLCNGKNTIDDIRHKLEHKLGLGKKERIDVNILDVLSSLERIGLIEDQKLPAAT
ncbi:MAG: hypothetical protein KKD39_04160 [Candidatus Altiarchaeota archaeon]|nr:hypothetical protein [Candidatus Altiarchaeota archaeon]